MADGFWVYAVMTLDVVGEGAHAGVTTTVSCELRAGEVRKTYSNEIGEAACTQK